MKNYLVLEYCLYITKLPKLILAIICLVTFCSMIIIRAEDRHGNIPRQHKINTVTSIDDIYEVRIVGKQDDNLYGFIDKKYGPLIRYSISESKLYPIHYLTQPQGVHPESMICYKSNLYGSTVRGGKRNKGVLFKISVITHKFRILHEFNGKDGFRPGHLMMAGGNLYGLALGGLYGLGEVFSFNDKDQFKILHSFNGQDGADPISLIKASNDNIYGSTEKGGENNQGVIYSINNKGDYKIIKNLHGNPIMSPHLIGYLKDTVYGYCGLNPSSSGYRIGLFSIDIKGNIYILYIFHNSSGLNPLEINLIGKELVGMLDPGGKYDAGTIFEYSIDHNHLSVLHNFESRKEFIPISLIPGDRNTFYGDTLLGSDPLKYGLLKLGAIFKVQISGKYRRIYHFPKYSTLFVNNHHKK